MAGPRVIWWLCMAVVVVPPFSFGQAKLVPDKPNIDVKPVGMLEDVREAYDRLEKEILSVWGAKYRKTYFTGQMEFSDGGEAVITKILRAVILQRPFVIGFTGTSVTAGHDNLFEESYPRVVHRMMGSLFALTGVKFEGRNGAMGNNPPTPYSFCVNRFTGSDADIVVWEMWMMVAGNHCTGGLIEAFIRTSISMPSRPAVLVLANVAGEHSCDEIPVHDYDKDEYMGGCDGKPRDPGLMTLYKDFGLHYMNPMYAAARETCGDPRYGRENLLGGNFKAGPDYHGWHPNRNGHELMGAMLTMHYGQVLLQALERLDAAFPGIRADHLVDERMRDEALKVLHIDAAASAAAAAKNNNNKAATAAAAAADHLLPTPQLCGDWMLCREIEQYRCATTFDPNYDGTNTDLLSLVTETKVYPAQRVVVPPPESFGGWSVIQNEDYPCVFPLDGRLYPIDIKWILAGDRSSGPLTLRFDVAGPGGGGGGKPGGVGVCRSHIVVRALYEDPDAVAFYLDKQKVTQIINFDEPVDRREPVTGYQCAWLDAFVGKGAHELRIEPLKDAPQPLVAIAWLFYPR